jgi:hypothetical protein
MRLVLGPAPVPLHEAWLRGGRPLSSLRPAVGIPEGLFEPAEIIRYQG